MNFREPCLSLKRALVAGIIAVLSLPSLAWAAGPYDEGMALYQKRDYAAAAGKYIDAVRLQPDNAQAAYYGLCNNIEN